MDSNNNSSEKNRNIETQDAAEKRSAYRGLWGYVEKIAEMLIQFTKKRAHDNFKEDVVNIITTILAINALPRYQRVLRVGRDSYPIEQYCFSKRFSWLVEPDAITISVGTADATDLRVREEMPKGFKGKILTPAEVSMAEGLIAADFKESPDLQPVDRNEIDLMAAIADGVVVNGKLADGHSKRAHLIKSLGLYMKGHYYVSINEFLTWKISELTK